MLTIRTFVPGVLAALLATTAALPGPLTPPPGAPGSTYKTLQEVEPRIPLSAATAPGDASSMFVIAQPGSYYLTGDLVGVVGKAGIKVLADHVTIDLNGFALRGVVGAGAAIRDHNDDEIPTLQNFRLQNGTVTGWPGGGISSFFIGSATIDSVVFHKNGSAGVNFNGDLLATDCQFNDHLFWGLLNQGNGVVRNCTATGNATGFNVSSTTLEGCLASGNGFGFDVARSLITECIATDNDHGGFSLGWRSTARNCHAEGSPVGFATAGFNVVIENCSVAAASEDGIRVASSIATIANNRFHQVGSSATHAAIKVNSGVSGVTIMGNSGTIVTRGVDVAGSTCLIVRNSFGNIAQGGTLLYNIVAGNRYGPIVNGAVGAPVSVAPGGSAPGGFTTTDPNANLSY